MRLLLIRHSAPDIAPGVCYGRLDVPARPDGLSDWLRDYDARRLPGQPWLGFERLLSSPASRCLALAHPLSRHLGLQVETCVDCREMDFGTWEGLSWEAIGRAAVDAWAADPVHHAPGGGESVLAMMQRVAPVHEALCAARQDTVVICHGGTIRLWRAWHDLRSAWLAPGADTSVPWSGGPLAAGPLPPSWLAAAARRAVRDPAPAPGGVIALDV